MQADWFAELTQIHAGLQYVLPATWTALQKLDPDSDTDTKLQMMANWWSLAPSKITGLNATKGQIAEGYDADLLVRPRLTGGLQQ